MDSGSSNTGSSRYMLQDPSEFAPRSQLDGTEAGHAWNNLVRPMSSDFALSWFSDHEHVPFLEWVQSERDFTPEGAEAIVTDFPSDSLLERSIIPDFMRSPEDLGSIVPLIDSPLGASILATLADLGVTGTPITVVGAGGIILETDIAFNWQGAWATGFGTRCNLWCQIMLRPDGREVAVFFTNLVVSTREIDSDFIRETTDSVVAGVPCQTLLYLAETPFPSGVMTFLRDMTWGEVQRELWPTPMVWVAEDALCSVVAGEGSGGKLEVHFATYPLAIKVGYAIEAMPAAELSKSLSVVLDSLVKAATIVEDGFRNVRNLDVSYSFDQVFKSEYDLMSESIGAVNGFARWIPEPLLGSLVTRTQENYELQYQSEGPEAERRASLQWIADYGAGQCVAAGINTLACAFLIPERDLEKASFYLRRAIEMNVWNESTNARTNFGALLIEAGELERAKAALVDALSQPDEFSEGEASLLLAQIFRAEGNESEAAEYYRRAIASGHPTYAEAAESELLKMDENTGPAEAVQTGAPEAEPIDRPNFCGNCGTRFAGADQNFCGNCGNSRGN
jgi:hypothetical protein